VQYTDQSIRLGLALGLRLGLTDTQMSSLQIHTHTHAHPFYGPVDFVRDYPGELVSEPIWILLKQETGGSGIS